MKNTLSIFAILFCSFTVSAQHSYISTNGNIVLEAGSIEEYDTPNIYCEATLQKRVGVWQVILSLTPAGAPSAGASVKTFQVDFAEADIDALTCAGSDNSDKSQNCVLQAVAAYLLALNPSITFTLN